MNLLITKEEHETLQKRVLTTYTIGSHLYKTNTENSDIDYLCIYDTFKEDLLCGLPNIHQFQYKEDKTDYIYTSDLQFWKNFYSGDSTINVDVVMFGKNDFTLYERLQWCRTYKIIKAFIGFAKRDIKQYKEGNHKLIHAKRSLYCAESLIDSKLPDLEYIKNIYSEDIDIKELRYFEKNLRGTCNKVYDEGRLLNYFIPKQENRLLEKLFNANNTKEFKYA